jgi:hypothetical protein
LTAKRRHSITSNLNRMDTVSKVTVDEMNVAIARFEQRKFYGKFTIDSYGPKTCNAYPVMKYHNSWDWLMQVVEKIEAIHHVIEHKYINVRISQGYVEIEGATERIFYNCSVEGSKIKATWLAVHHFITWYNAQNK